MVSRARRRLTAEERRAKILSAAVQGFATDGYDRTSMDRIAALSKVTKPVLYDHFPSKQALFLTVLESIRDGLIAKGKAPRRKRSSGLAKPAAERAVSDPSA